MPGDIVLRALQETDVQAVYDVALEAWHSTYKNIYPTEFETIARIPGCFRQPVPHVRCGGFGGALPLGLLATCPAPSVR
jgi:hypothetical protein